MYNKLKKLNNKLLTLLLALAMAFTLIGCTGTQPDDSQNPPTQSEIESGSETVTQPDVGSESESGTSDITNPDQGGTGNTESETPSQPSEPSESDKPSEPDEPSESSKPSQPNEPSESDKPSEPNEPSESDKPSEPSEPSESDKPSEPSEPSESDKPSEPNEPSESDKPSQPDEPSESEKPGNSEDPGNTEEPTEPDKPSGNHPTDLGTPGITLSEIPKYTDKDYIALNNNIPYFAKDKLPEAGLEYYSPLDRLGRCGITYALLGPETLPTEERGDINSVTPSGWVSSSGGNQLYNRSHLIAHSLAGENDNPKNLITGTSHMNQHTMQIFENMVLDYIKETGNHVVYRVIPLFDGNNLVATGVQMEAWSVEDNGASICFNVFCYNIQEGVSIDYATGQYELSETTYKYIVNGNRSNGKIHTYECGIKSNLKNPIYCETWEEAVQKSMEVTGKSQPQYAGCCHPENTAP